MLRRLREMFSRPGDRRLGNATAELDAAAEGFRRAAEKSGPPHARVFWDLAGATADLRNRIGDDPDAISPLRKLIFFFIPKMSDLALRWAGLAALTPLEAPDPGALEEFQSYLSLIRSAERACLSRRFADLQSSMTVMETQLEQHHP